MTDPHANWRPKHSPWLITLSVLLATFMEILDTSIANVALPHIGGSLSATVDESTWVLTSYLVANAIILPASGWLSNRFGRKRYLAFSVMIFTIASAFCGLAQTLPQLILARLFQGLGGGGLQPVVQAVLLESFSPEERGGAMAAYGMGVVVAPIVGPTLGGWITDNFSWRWIFLINLPIGLLGLYLQNLYLEDPPYLQRSKAGIDSIGFGLMALWIGTLQLVLDKGQEADWFDAPWICWAIALATVAFIAFIYWELREKEPLVKLRLLRNSNFANATLQATLIFSVIYGTTVLLPVMMQTLLGYSAFQAGWAMGPRGIGSFLAMVAVGGLMKKMDNRLLIGGGLLAIAVTCWLLGGMTLDITSANISWPLVLNGIGAGFIFVPMTTLSVATLRRDEIQHSTGIYSLMRNLGSSVGISVVTAMQTRLTQVHQSRLSSHLTATSPAYLDSLHRISLSLHGLSSFDAKRLAPGVIYQELLRQASLLAYIDIFRALAVLCVLCLPLVLLFRRSDSKAPVETEMAMH
jgi:MFS transporter, DHA2 family, multidrug resistance protein